MMAQNISKENEENGLVKAEGLEMAENKNEINEEKITEDEEKILKEKDEEERAEKEKREKLAAWVPKTELGRAVKSGKIKDIQEVFDSGKKILEPEIVDSLLNLKTELLNIGQAKGKFGGGKRRVWKQTQKKTQEGNVVSFSVMAVVGDEAGHVGIGVGKAKETLPAREKAIRKAKLNIRKVERGCGSYDCSCNEPHSIPMATQGKCSSVVVKLMPAPQGTGLVTNDELKKILRLAGIKDIYSKTFGNTRTTINMAKACIKALDKLGDIKK